MTPIGHCASGVGVGGVLSPVLNKSFKVPYRALTVIFIISSLLPDIDAVSLLFNHRIYFGKWWYSHHMLGHSLIGAAVFAIIIALIYITIAIALRGMRNLFRREKLPLEGRIRRFIGALLAAYIGCLAHFLGDLPTPPGPWGGIALMWPKMEMYGGWGKIYWHNYYIIYLSIAFLIGYLAVQFVAGAFSSVRIKYTQWAGYLFRGISVIMSLFFLYKVALFVQESDYRSMGREKWIQYNRTLVPEQYVRDADKYHYQATVFWRKRVITRDDLIATGNRILDWFEDRHRAVAPVLSAIMPRLRSAEEEMQVYRSLQEMAPGMEDARPGSYRVWIIRDAFPDPHYYNRGFTIRYFHHINRHLLQMTNARMIVFRIDERDQRGGATRVSCVYHSNKIYVPDNRPPQLYCADIKHSSLNLWKHDRIPYNLIPRSSYSRYRNLIKGFFPSLNTTPGYLWPGVKTGIAIHAGMLSLGCIIAVYGHLDIGSHLQHPFFPLWETADDIINIHVVGNRFRGAQKIWGRLLFIRNPETLLPRENAHSTGDPQKGKA